MLDRSRIVEKAIFRLERLDTALHELKARPGIVRDELWANTAIDTARLLNEDGQKLQSSASVPPPAAQVHDRYHEVGRKFTAFANLLYIAILNARGHPPGPWEKVADEAEDTLDDIASEIEDAHELILDMCG